jgi:hypothetical protein
LELAKLHRFNRWETCPHKTRSLYYNYKGYFSVILVACADADILFTTVHIGDFGKNSDGSVFRASTLGEMLKKEELHIPFPTPYHWMTAAKHLPTTSWQMKHIH